MTSTVDENPIMTKFWSLPPVEKAYGAYARTIKPKVDLVTKHPRVRAASDWLQSHQTDVARTMIALYFLNLGCTNFSFWFFYNVPGVPWSAFVDIPCSILVLAKFKVHIFGSALLAMALKDAGHISYGQFAKWWWEGHELYINELMVKKFSMIGALCMLLLKDPYFGPKLETTSKALQGLIMKDAPKYKVSQRASIILLIVRLLISSLFLFVGYGEIKRQLAWSHGVVHHGHVHRRADGDGHNQLWLKFLQFALSLPFVVGLKTSLCARLLCASMLWEAFWYWSWWSTLLGLWYQIHARDHFSVNVGVGGGLLLLQSIGPGKYSVDELLKKNRKKNSAATFTMECATHNKQNIDLAYDTLLFLGELDEALAAKFDLCSLCVNLADMQWRFRWPQDVPLQLNGAASKDMAEGLEAPVPLSVMRRYGAVVPVYDEAVYEQQRANETFIPIDDDAPPAHRDQAKYYCLVGGDAYDSLVLQKRISRDDQRQVNDSVWYWLVDLFKVFAAAKENPRARRLASCWYCIATVADLLEGEVAEDEDDSSHGSSAVQERKEKNVVAVDNDSDADDSDDDVPALTSVPATSTKTEANAAVESDDSDDEVPALTAVPATSTSTSTKANAVESNDSDDDDDEVPTLTAWPATSTSAASTPSKPFAAMRLGGKFDAFQDEESSGDSSEDSDEAPKLTLGALARGEIDVDTDSDDSSFAMSADEDDESLEDASEEDGDEGEGEDEDEDYVDEAVPMEATDTSASSAPPKRSVSGQKRSLFDAFEKHGGKPERRGEPSEKRKADTSDNASSLASALGAMLGGAVGDDGEREELPEEKEARDAILSSVADLHAYMPSPDSHMPFFKRMLKKMQSMDDQWFPWGAPPVQRIVDELTERPDDDERAKFLREVLTVFANAQQ